MQSTIGFRVTVTVGYSHCHTKKNYIKKRKERNKIWVPLKIKVPIMHLIQ